MNPKKYNHDDKSKVRGSNAYENSKKNVGKSKDKGVIQDKESQ
jgi:hypothetical protein